MNWKRLFFRFLLLMLLCFLLQGCFPQKVYAFEIPMSYSLVIDYYEKGREYPIDSYFGFLSPGEEYRIETPSYLPGYVPDIPIVSGIMPDHDVSINVTYSRPEYTLTVLFVFPDGTEAAPSYVGKFEAGTEYTIPAPPSIPGHSVGLLPSGTMPERDLTLTVYYRYLSYEIVISYVLDDGTVIGGLIERKYFGESYSYVSPEYEGYVPDIPIVSGVMDASGNNDFMVTYHKKTASFLALSKDDFSPLLQSLISSIKVLFPIILILVALFMTFPMIIRLIRNASKG